MINRHVLQNNSEQFTQKKKKKNDVNKYKYRDNKQNI